MWDVAPAVMVDLGESVRAHAREEAAAKAAAAAAAARGKGAADGDDNGAPFPELCGASLMGMAADKTRDGSLAGAFGSGGHRFPTNHQVLDA